MKRLQEKNPIWFAVAWIVIYCVLSVPIRGNRGDESVQMCVGLGLIAAALALTIAVTRRWNYYGLDHWPETGKKLLWLLPLWLLTTGNLWGGIAPTYSGAAQIYAVVSMALIGFIEEVIFRGFLFRAMLKKDGARAAVIVSAVTFGIGHLVNLFAGQGGWESVMQVLFAISLGFVFTLVYYKGGSLLPCILAHSLVDVFSKYSTDSLTADWIYVIATIVIGGAYSLWLVRQESALREG